MAELNVTLPEVFSMCNWDYKILNKQSQKSKYRTICPSCGSKSLEANDNVARCWSCENSFNAISFTAAVCNIDNKQAYKRLLKEGKIDTSSSPVKHQIKKENPLADIEKRNKANQAIINALFLSKAHKYELTHKRGVSADVFYKLGYRSYPTSKELRLKAAKEAEIHAGSINGIPGLYTDNKTSKPIMCWRKKGILVPYRDIHFRIQGFQNRKNDEVREKDEDGKLENKYDHVSSGGKLNGTASTTFVHFACDFYVEWKTKEKWPRLGKSIFLTEGAMKADIAHYYSSLPFIAIPGVNARTQLEPVLKQIKERGVDTLYDCFDMDYLSNKSVQKARNAIKELCESIGITYKMVTWDENYKGIDDYIIYLSKTKSTNSFIEKYN